MFLSTISLKQQSKGRRVTKLGTHYPDSVPTSLCSYSFMLHAKRRSNKYKFDSLWLDPTKLKLTIYGTWGLYDNHYTPLTWFLNIGINHQNLNIRNNDNIESSTIGSLRMVKGQAQILIFNLLQFSGPEDSLFDWSYFL